MTWQETFVVAAAFATAALYLVVAFALGRRKVAGPGASALALFRLWWALLAVTTLVAPLQLWLFRAGRLRPWLFEFLSEASLLLIMVALWALLCFLVFLYRGRTRSWPWLGALYLVFYLATLALIDAHVDGTSLASDGWTIAQDPEPTIPEWGTSLFLVALVGPQLGAGIAYLMLVRVTDDATTRYRIMVVGISILLWFGTSLVAGFARLDSDGWHVISRLIGAGAAAMILLGYFPPAALRRRYGLRALGEETGPAAA